MKMKFAVLLLVCFPLWSLALTNQAAPVIGETVAPLEGNWVLEKATVQKVTGSNTETVELSAMKDNPFVALFDALQFTENTLSLSLADSYFQGEYIWTGSTIEIHFTPAPLVLSYRVEGEKTYFTQEMAEGCPGCVYVVQTVYKKD